MVENNLQYWPRSGSCPDIQTYKACRLLSGFINRSMSAALNLLKLRAKMNQIPTKLRDFS